MMFGSVCSGIEAASVAWEPFGWRAAWFSEIEPFPSAVLAHHYPDVQNLGDMSRLPGLIRSGDVSAPDVFCGGTPCQAFSVAGLRRSLDDQRGNLSLTFVEIANAIDDVRRARNEPETVVFWENVPGVLSTRDNAFGCFLGALAGCDTAIFPLAATGWTDAGMVAGPVRAVAWRTLDAQYFGLAQRRKRVFVVASAREGVDPAAVLFEWEGVRRDFAPSREAGQRVAPTIAGCANGGGANGPGRDADSAESLQVMSSGQAKEDGTGRGTPLVPIAFHPTQDPISSSDGATHAMGTGSKGGCATVAVAFTQNSRSEVREIGGDGQITGSIAANAGAQQQNYVMQAFEENFHAVREVDVAPAMTTEGYRVSQNAGGLGLMMQPLAFSVCPDHCGGDKSGQEVAFVNAIDVSRTLDCTGADVTRKQGGVGIVTATLVKNQSHAVAFKYTMGAKAHGIGYAEEQAPTLDTRPESNAVMQAMQVRRLTPRECERLQGFPDGYTAIPWRNKPASECPDGPRYKALGNSWAVPVVRWIGARIDRALRGRLG